MMMLNQPPEEGDCAAWYEAEIARFRAERFEARAWIGGNNRLDAMLSERIARYTRIVRMIGWSSPAAYHHG